MRKFCELGPRKQPVRVPCERKAPSRRRQRRRPQKAAPGPSSQEVRGSGSSPPPTPTPRPPTSRKPEAASFTGPSGAGTRCPGPPPGDRVLTHLMQVLQGQHDLAPIHAHLGLLEVLALVEVGEHFATVHIVWGRWEWKLGSSPHGWPHPPHRACPYPG